MDSPLGRLKLVVVTDDPHAQRRCKTIADAIAVRIIAMLRDFDERIDVEISLLDAEVGPVRLRKNLPARAEIALRCIERADMLVVGAPVCRGSYSAHFKHVFDLIDPAALVGVPVALTAVGGSERDALVVEHQLRPLFGFFQALTLPTTVFASEVDFFGPQLSSPHILARIDRVATEAVLAVEARNRHEAARLDPLIEIAI